VNVAGGSDVTVFWAEAVPARQTSAKAEAAKRVIGIMTHVKSRAEAPGWKSRYRTSRRFAPMSRSREKT
jgi:hypothetical protein